MIDLSICIVNWNTGDLLCECIRSVVQAIRELTYEIILVDSGSSDFSVERVEELSPKIEALTIIRNKTNLGFAACNNMALSKSQGRYIALLNPDTVVLDCAFDKAIRSFDRIEKCGVMAPMLLNSDGSVQFSVGGFPTPSRMLWEATRLRLIFPKTKLFSQFKKYDMDYSVYNEVDQPSGACLIISRAAMHQVGLLDERYFMYFEEVDYCLRMKEAGWKIIFNPEAVIIHHGGQSSNKNPHVRIVEYARSYLRFFGKHYSGNAYALALVRLALLMETLLKGGALIIHPGNRQLSTIIARKQLECYIKVLSLALSPNSMICKSH